MMTLQDWINLGVEKGYCSAPVCATHDGVPTSEAEDNEWEEGSDPCAVVVRLYLEPGLKEAVERNYPGNYSG